MTNPDDRGCTDYSRSELLRATFASAGRGLPDVERGMPIPAGTGLSRRAFLARSGGLALTVFGAQSLAPPAFQAGIDSAAAAAPGERILVSICLPGGLDSLSLLAPAGDPNYAALRPTLAVAPSDADRFRDDDRLYWNPAAAPLRALHAANKISMIPAVGYSSPNQSHFTSRHFWEVGELDPAGRVGWLGRFLDRHGVADNPLQGLALDSVLAPSLAPERVPVAAVSRPESFSLDARDAWDMRTKLFDALDTLGSLPTSDRELGAARRAVGQTADLRDSLGALQGAKYPFGATVPYPNTSDAFPRRLAALARMISDGLPLRCVALNANGGYDTHENQAASLTKNLAMLSQSLAAFQADLEARGLADRVLVHVWSEFGRRAKENGSGTDHGAGGLSFVMGTQATGQTIEQFPGLGAGGLDAGGNLRATADFRGVYASLLEQWFAVDPQGIVPNAGQFKRYALARTA